MKFVVYFTETTEYCRIILAENEVNARKRFEKGEKTFVPKGGDFISRNTEIDYIEKY